MRFMTFNIQGGRGRDNRTDLKRIAELARHVRPAAWAVQELWVGAHDQVAQLRQLTSMQAHFTPTEELSQGVFGHAIFAKEELRNPEVLLLPPDPIRWSPPRWASRVEIGPTSDPITVVNMHLGLEPEEREAQVGFLQDRGWLRGSRWVVMGDLNCTPGAKAMRMMQSRLRRLTGWRYCSWPTPFPFLPLDHILVSENLKPLRVETVREGRARWASDHLAVWSELQRV